MTIQLHSYESYTVSGRGLIKCVTSKLYPAAADVEPGDKIMIDDTEYTVKAIETYVKLMYPPIRGTEFGFVVSEGW